MGAIWAGRGVFPPVSCGDLFGRKLETDFLLVVQHQEGGERAARFGDKIRKQIGAAVLRQLLELFAVDRLLQNGLLDVEPARALVRLRFLTEVRISDVEDAAAANRAD